MSKRKVYPTPMKEIPSSSNLFISILEYNNNKIHARCTCRLPWMKEQINFPAINTELVVQHSDIVDIFQYERVYWIASIVSHIH